MIVRFAHFGKTIEKTQKKIQRTVSKKQYFEHEKSFKKGLEIELKTMKKHPKNDTFFEDSKNQVFLKKK